MTPAARVGGAFACGMVRTRLREYPCQKPRRPSERKVFRTASTKPEYLVGWARARARGRGS